MLSKEKIQESPSIIIQWQPKITKRRPAAARRQQGGKDWSRTVWRATVLDTLFQCSRIPQDIPDLNPATATEPPSERPGLYQLWSNFGAGDGLEPMSLLAGCRNGEQALQQAENRIRDYFQERQKTHRQALEAIRSQPLGKQARML